jgi:hypothetical protein
MAHRIAGIDVHKRMLAVVGSDVEVDGEYQFGAHRQCRLIWLILHQGVRYEEHGPAVTKQSRQARTARMIRQLRKLGYQVELPNPQVANSAGR